MTASQSQKPELIFALIGGAGVRLDDLRSELRKALQSFGYHCEHIGVSKLLEDFVGWTPLTEKIKCPEYTRIKHLQEFAFRVRKMAGPEALAIAAITAIRTRRAVLTGDPDKAAPATAYILQQLKHPREVSLLRQVYGQSVLVLAGHATHDSRELRLCQTMAGDAGSLENDSEFKNYASDIINIDEKERRSGDVDDLGQNTRDTYPLADFFVNLERDGGERHVWHFVELLFGHPFHTPSPDEVAMYHANAMSLRSSDDSRQVGAVIVDEGSNRSRPDLDIIATGLNEVPRAGGGFYWHGLSPDYRDQALANEADRAQAIKRFALTEIIDRLKEEKWLSSALEKEQGYELARKLYPLLKGTQFMDIGEFMRPVHAEMAALIDAARRGVAVQGKSMYVTAFPCHNCAKHIIAAGIRRVVYLEPYPKSRAQLLHREEMNMETWDGHPTDHRVAFGGFTGVAPRQYARLYSMVARGRKSAMARSEWEARRLSLSPRYVLQNAAGAYLPSEREAVARLQGKGYVSKLPDAVSV